MANKVAIDEALEVLQAELNKAQAGIKKMWDKTHRRFGRTLKERIKALWFEVFVKPAIESEIDYLRKRRNYLFAVQEAVLVGEMCPLHEFLCDLAYELFADHETLLDKMGHRFSKENELEISGEPCIAGLDFRQMIDLAYCFRSNVT